MRRRTAFLTLVGLSLTSIPARAAVPYTFIVVPDTQNYTDFANEQQVYNIGQMNWIVNNKTALNIKFVMHMGDFQNPGNPYRTQAGNIYEPDLTRPVGDVNDKNTKWGRADAAIDVLDAAGIPYSLVPGNHDYLNYDNKTEPYLYLKTFGPTRYINSPKYDELGHQTYRGASPATATFAWAGVSTYHIVYAGGYNWLNIALQDDPDANDLAWAQSIINANPNLPTMITTHEYVNTAGAGTDYQHPAIWNTFVKNNPQIVMTFNGHLTGENRVTGTNIAGKAVQQMLADYQADQFDTQFGADYYKGAGILRTVQVDPTANQVNIKSYSPIANQYLTDADSQFSFALNLKSRFGPADGTGTAGFKTFRNNLNGYTATKDTVISAANPNTNYSTDPTAVLSNDFQGDKSRALIRFENLFGSTAIPDNATIDHAELHLHTDSSANSQSTNNIRVYRMLVPWTPTTVTWNALTGGVDTDGLEAVLAEDSLQNPTILGGEVIFDVTESVYAWDAGAPNYGWLITTNGTDNWRFDTSENSTNSLHPSLTVNYRTDTAGAPSAPSVPEPTSLLACFAILPLLRRHRA